jgi:hypothetical protein
MKKALVILVLFFCGIVAQAQTLSMSDLTNLATFDMANANNFLVIGKPFKQTYIQDINKLTIHHYQGKTPTSKNENVTVGDGFVTASGTLLHKVTYTSTQIKYIQNLIGQTHSVGLHRLFLGSDKYNNIYVYNNQLYTVRIFIKNDNSSGTVEVKQNDFVNY